MYRLCRRQLVGGVTEIHISDIKLTPRPIIDCNVASPKFVLMEFSGI